VKYTVLFERGPTSYGATVPGLPGCFSVGKTLEQARHRIAEAMALHIEGLREDGDPVPEPSSYTIEEVEVAPSPQPRRKLADARRS
jgi:predicted RNase H-like HicB family nuclease